MPLLPELLEDTAITISLNRRDRQVAHTQSQTLSAGATRDRVRRNQLAIQAMQTYCRYLGIATDQTGCDSADPLRQVLDDVADLRVAEMGVVDCRPIAPQDAVLAIPGDSWSQRDAYVAIALSEDETEAQLLGFVLSPSEAVGEIALDQLQPIAELFTQLAQRVASPVAAAAAQLQAVTEPIPSAVTQLMGWLEGCFEAGWETVDDWMQRSTDQKVWAFRSVANATSADPTTIRRGKHLEFGHGDVQIALFASVQPVSFNEININVDVWAISKGDELPVGLAVAIADDQGHELMRSEATRHNAALKFEFNVERGERFQVVLTLDQLRIVEYFSA
jgi:hypothetical protein